MFMHEYFLEKLFEDKRRRFLNVSHYDGHSNRKQRSGVIQKIKNLINRNISGSLISPPRQTCCDC